MSGCRRSADALLVGVSAVALLSGLAGSPAFAQTTYLDPITVVASRTEEVVIQALAGVSAVRTEQLNQILPTRLEDAFFGVPGINFQQRADDPGMAVNIRGLQDFGRVAVVIDGARQNFQRTGHQADGLVYMEPELLAGVDVVRGPVANIYGSGAIGGVVSMRTIDTQDILKPGERFATQLHGLVASNMVQGLGSAFFAARPVDNFDFMVGTTARQRGDYKDGNGNLVVNSHFRVITEIGKVNIRPADGHELKFGFINYQADYDSGLPGGTPRGSVYATEVNNQIATGRWRYNRPDDRVFDFDVNTYWTKNKTVQVKFDGTNSAITGALGSRRSFQVETIGVDANNTSRWESGPWRAALTVGADAFQDQVTVVDPSGTGDFFTPNGQRTVSGAFAQLRTNYTPWVELITAARYDNYRLEGANGVGGSSGDRVSPKATLGITPIQWFTVYGTYAEGYRAPAVTEVFVNGAHPAPAPFTLLSNLSLKPEIGKTKEIGINIKQDGLFVANDALRIKVNVYQNDVTDFIEQTGARQRPAGAGWSHLHDADFRLHPVPEHSVRPHPRRGAREQLRRRLVVPRRRGKHPERRGPHQESPAGEDLSGAGYDHGRRAVLGPQGHGGGALAGGGGEGRERHSAGRDGAADGRLQCRQPLSRLPAERGHNSGVWNRQPVQRVLREVS